MNQDQSRGRGKSAVVSIDAAYGMAQPRTGTRATASKPRLKKVAPPLPGPHEIPATEPSWVGISLRAPGAMKRLETFTALVESRS